MAATSKGYGMVAPQDRVNIRYRTETEEIELPLRLLVMGDFNGQGDSMPVEERTPLSVDKHNFDEVLRTQNICLNILVDNMVADTPGQWLRAELRIENLKDFEPETVGRQIPELRDLWKLREALTEFEGQQPLNADFMRRLPKLQDEGGEWGGDRKQALWALFKETLEVNTDPHIKPEERRKVDCHVVDWAVAELDKKLGQQIDKIIHNEKFQKIESAWRSLKFLVDRSDFRQNIRISVLNVSKQELLDNFRDAPELFQSGLYYHVYKLTYGQSGSKPYGAIIGNYDFNAGIQDIELLRFIGRVAAMAHAPFIAAAEPQMFGLESFERLSQIADLRGLFENKQYIDWRSLRDSEVAPYIALTAPRFLLRRPYGPESPTRGFNYTEESNQHSHYLWGNTAFALATRLTESFAKYRWCPNIIGLLSGGAVEQLPVHYKSDGDCVQKISTEVLISERLEYELSEEGFIALAMLKDSEKACFSSANSIQKPKSFAGTPEGKAAEVNARLGAQLPYMFIISRLAHYVKLIQREALGAGKDKKDLQSDLEKWIRQYVVEDDNPMPSIRAQRPLRSAEIKVDEVTERPGWYSVSIKVRPHFKYMGESFTLSLVGQQRSPAN